MMFVDEYVQATCLVARYSLLSSIQASRTSFQDRYFRKTYLLYFRQLRMIWPDRKPKNASGAVCPTGDQARGIA
jgi:hypothetical protein